MKKVIVFGVFDLLHPGHLYFLKQARKYGDHLTVVVTRDARVKAEKKQKPIFSERERMEMVGALKSVDKAMLGDRVGKWKVLKRLRPDVVAVGYDQNTEWIQYSQFKKIPLVVKVNSMRANIYRSSKLTKKIIPPVGLLLEVPAKPRDAETWQGFRTTESRDSISP